ncbi:MAG TPA: hypothetical protein VG929_00075 [Actinomycetota bacterium]|nr:hypothetical protein [Actinomycetota bacterium]
MANLIRHQRPQCFVLVGAVVFALALGACGDADPDVAVENDTAVEDASETATFFSDPAPLVGERVTVHAVVDEVVDPNGFRMVAEDPSGDSFLVIHDGREELSAGDFVIVAGTVSEFDVAVVENEMGLDLDQESYELYEGEYGIQAETIETKVE